MVLKERIKPQEAMKFLRNIILVLWPQDLLSRNIYQFMALSETVISSLIYDTFNVFTLLRYRTLSTLEMIYWS